MCIRDRCKKSRRKGKENQIEVLNAPRFDTINSEISFKKQKSNDEVKELDLKISSLEGQIKELEKVILEQNSEIENLYKQLVRGSENEKKYKESENNLLKKITDLEKKSRQDKRKIDDLNSKY